MSDMEEWRPIPGYEDLYEVSSHGRVKSLPRYIRAAHGSMRRIKGRIRTPRHSSGGYPTVSLHDDGKGQTYSVHTLVAEVFLPEMASERIVTHIDGDRTNNRASNLLVLDRRPAGSGTSKLTEEQVLEVRERVAAGETRTALGEEFGVDRTTIGNIANGKNWRWL